MTNLVIKRLSGDDVDLLRRVIVLFKSGDQSERHIDQIKKLNETHLLVALKDDMPVGFLLGYELPRLSTADRMMFIYEIEVLEEQRRKGIGRILVESVLSHCHYQGFSKAFVITEESNIAAMRLYQECGGKRSHDDDVVFKFETRGGF